MPVVSSIFLVLSLVMAVVIGPQTRPWSWGPAMLALGISVLAACPSFWKRDRSSSDFGLIAFCTAVAGWFAFRAMTSPVAELAQADLLLLCATVGTFISVRSICGHQAAGKILIWGTALLLLANVVVAGKQMVEPGYMPVFREQPDFKMVSGFFAHYNEAANFFIVSSIFVGAAALFGRHHPATRILWFLIAAAGFAGVWFSRSRGGIFGAAVALGVFSVVSLIIAKKRGSAWFAPALIALPLLALGVGSYLFIGWQGAQAARNAASDGIGGMFDNNSRLYLLGLALSCFNLHPVFGGGSRSFSWECFRFADGKAQGDIITHRPELVHNELVQSATDYGLIGSGLLIGLLGTLAVVALLRILFDPSGRDSRSSDDAWRLGALAGLAGMMVQSCFSFVFHLMPGILFLGICLGAMSTLAGGKGQQAKIIGTRALLSLAAASCCAMLFFFGWQGTRVTSILWPVLFSKVPTASTESRIDAFSEALRIWPQSGFLQDRAREHQTLAEEEKETAEESLTAAIEDYDRAAVLHPYDPSISINKANLLSHMARDAEAEESYALGIRLQGGMEPGFRGYFSLANHFLRKGLRLFKPEEPGPALEALELAAQQMDKAISKMHWIVRDMPEPRLSIYESLGAAREAAGDREGALQIYDAASKLQNGNRAHYRAGIMIGKMATEAWGERRPAEALGYFIKARERIAAAKELPQGVAPSQRAEYLAYLDQTIAFLKGAKIQPVMK